MLGKAQEEQKEEQKECYSKSLSVENSFHPAIYLPRNIEGLPLSERCVYIS